jgi:methylenetetrahydrofolate dehydrogenase (NADP+)/methenyltetrahydrofolate cyclohydrolase
MIVQLPLPQNIDSEKIINLIPKNKDADGLSGIDEVNSSNIVTPATARAVLAILDYYQIAIKDKKVAIIGRSKLAGGPVAQVLSGRGGKVTVCHRGTQDIATVCRGSDILISAAGQAGLVTRDFVNEKQVVVDVGINRATSPTLPPWGRVSGNPSPLERGGGEVLKPKIVGDVAFSEVEPIVASITPVPGGVGPLTVACLFANLLDLVKTP